MLLQGFACDQSQNSHSPFAPLARMPSNSAVAAALALASPPASPPQMAAPNTLGHLFDSCRSLQALLAAPPPPSSLPITPPQQHLATPPLDHAPSPMKLRLRTPRRAGSMESLGAPTGAPTSAPSKAANSAGVARKRIVKRTATSTPTPTPRGLNKRRRAVDDDMGRAENETTDASDSGDAEDPLSSHDSSEPFTLSLLAPSPLRRYPSSSPFTSATSTRRARAATIANPFLPAFNTSENTTLLPPPVSDSLPSATPSTPPRPQTPKRARIAPEALPLGLERSDFHALHADGIPDDSSRAHNHAAGTPVEVEADGEAWSTEDDRMLVELVLEKLKLSKEEWQDCARSLGKDRHSLGRRWKSLMLHGDIGLKPGSRTRRSKIHGTWR
ncbi:DNA-binding protein [Sporothrix schenckii 1099-18]|uniref:DNA-binding protein n=1 Tax=Sporothrix schenckii 1099-18 TaxID=1397361 RepID=A0A0F2M5F2_SPOSC|nr:DNA-binding protein [Sporothrix schenckii 1099-18]KJR84852.1 DNA-binding protein [Sporothrix schenckii 1099-18]